MSFLITEVGYSLSTETGDPLVYDGPPNDIGPVLVAGPGFSDPLRTERGNCITWHSRAVVVPRGHSLITEYGQPLFAGGGGSAIAWQGIGQSVTRKYVRVVPPLGSTPRLIDLPAVGPDQLQTCAIDYGKLLPPGVTLSGIPELRVSLHFGVDDHPSSRISAGPEVGTIAPDIGGTGRPNAAILFQVYGGLHGVTYLIDFRCARSDGDAAENCVRLSCVARS
jgi:hypothetical protein